jgi:hypothetical protein
VFYPNYTVRTSVGPDWMLRTLEGAAFVHNRDPGANAACGAVPAIMVNPHNKVWAGSDCNPLNNKYFYPDRGWRMPAGGRKLRLTRIATIRRAATPPPPRPTHLGSARRAQRFTRLARSGHLVSDGLARVKWSTPRGSPRARVSLFRQTAKSGSRR